MQEGDERKLIVSSVEDGLLAHVAADLLEEPEFNIGEMPFHVDDVTSFTPDVGEPGTQGIIESGTGLLIRIPPWRCEEYGIDHPGATLLSSGSPNTPPNR